jgi:hypothetical protein
VSPARTAFHRSAAASFPEHAFTLHFLLQDAKSLIDIVIADEYLHWLGSGCSSSALGVTREHPTHTRSAHTVEC